MLVSMTGYGESRVQTEDRSVQVELRAINNRHFKLSARISSPHDALEPEIEKQIRASIQRGTIQLHLRVERPRRPEDYRLNLLALGSYREQVSRLSEGDSAQLPTWGDLLRLPGVVEDARADGEDPHVDWPVVEAALGQAIAKLHAARTREGRAMAAELTRLAEVIRGRVQVIDERAPQVVGAYRDRLLERVRSLVENLGVGIEAKDLIREVAIFAERSDVAEELTRLKAHLDEFVRMIAGAAKGREPIGRALEFVLQEMGREANTLGSKAGDVSISQQVVEIKSALESMRELVLNVE